MSFLSSGGRAPPIRSAATSMRPFPTSFRCPTLTIVALAIRQAEYIVEQLKTGSIPTGARAWDGRDPGAEVARARAGRRGGRGAGEGGRGLTPANGFADPMPRARRSGGAGRRAFDDGRRRSAR